MALRAFSSATTSVASAEQAQTKIIDIMEALMASLAVSDTKRKPVRRAGKKTTTKTKTSRSKSAR